MTTVQRSMARTLCNSAWMRSRPAVAIPVTSSASPAGIPFSSRSRPTGPAAVSIPVVPRRNYECGLGLGRYQGSCRPTLRVRG